MEVTPPLLYITGTNTGVGKTTLARLLLRRARERNLQLAAMKPFCSGGREDAEQLHALQTTGLTLDEVNPFHFPEPIAPYVAARNHQRPITLSDTISPIRKVQARRQPFLIEGAGGLMSPLGERFTLLDIIHEVPGQLCVVAPNILGAINSALLTHHALKDAERARSLFILMHPANPDASSATNARVIREWTNLEVFEFPFLIAPDKTPPQAVEILDNLLRCLGFVAN